MPLRNIASIGLAILISLCCYSIAAKNRYASIFSSAMQIVSKEALVQKTERELFNAAMEGMLSNLDQNSGFIAHDRFQAFNDDINQQYVGVGMEIDRDDEFDCIRVIAPMPDTPAYNAGLQVGDLLLEIDGKSTKGLPRPEAIQWIRGPKGEDVVFTVQRIGADELLKIVVTRDEIPVASVYGDTRGPDRRWRFVLEDEPRIGYIRLNQFAKRSTEEMQEALESINGNVDALILDLRSNPGGLLDAAVDISDMFLGREVLIVQTRKRSGEMVRPRYATSKTVIPTSIPLVVLVNQYSASGSEIVAACLQDHKRAIVVGTQTYGKGTVQDLITLERDRSIMRLTTSSYWRPSGKNIDKTIPLPDGSNMTEYGVRPDDGFEVELTEEQFISIARSRNLRDQRITDEDGNLMPTPATSTDEAKAAEKVPWLEVDLPLRRAVEHLREVINGRSAA